MKDTYTQGALNLRQIRRDMDEQVHPALRTSNEDLRNPARCRDLLNPTSDAMVRPGRHKYCVQVGVHDRIPANSG